MPIHGGPKRLVALLWGTPFRLRREVRFVLDSAHAYLDNLLAILRVFILLA